MKNFYYTNQELSKLNVVYGENVKISKKVSIYCTELKVGNNVRIDDFCHLAGSINIGSFVHIATHNILNGGDSGITISDFVGIAARCHIFSRTDDYRGGYFNGPLVPKELTNQTDLRIEIKKHALIGSGCIVLPGSIIGEGVSIFLNSVVRGNLNNWSIYSGNPIRKVGKRDESLKDLEQKNQDIFDTKY